MFHFPRVHIFPHILRTLSRTAEPGISFILEPADDKGRFNFQSIAIFIIAIHHWRCEKFCMFCFPRILSMENEMDLKLNRPMSPGFFRCEKMIFWSLLYIKRVARYKEKCKALWVFHFPRVHIFLYISRMLWRTAEIDISFFAGEDGGWHRLVYFQSVPFSIAGIRGKRNM